MQDGCDFARVQGPVVAELTPVGDLPPPWMEFGIGAFREPSAQSLAEMATANANNMNLNATGSSSGSGSGSSLSLQFEQWYNNLSEGEKNCQLFDEDTTEKFIDNAWTTARTFAFLALVLGGGGSLFLWASTFFVFSRGTWRWTGYLILIGSLCNSMTSLWYLTSICSWNTCTMFWGSKTSILASSLWFFGGLFIVCRYPTPVTHRMQKLDQEEPVAGVFMGEKGSCCGSGCGFTIPALDVDVLSVSGVEDPKGLDDAGEENSIIKARQWV